MIVREVPLFPSADLFSVTVPDEGFEWRRAKGGNKVLCEKGSPSNGSEYYPLRDRPALFRNFAALKREPESILEFANLFGRLLTVGSTRRANSTGVEDFEFWVTEIETMRACVSVSAQAHRVGETARTIIEAATTASPEFRSFFPPAINAHALSTSNAVAAVRTITKDRLEKWTVVTLVSRGLPNTILAALPINLLGALWLQLATSLSTNVSYRQCSYCADWFEVSRNVTGATRAKRFCSDACRLRAHRQSINSKVRKKGR